jgi:xanthine dehydrogenase molybdopterin-binding subunit B
MPADETDDATRALRHESGLGHATGVARYVDDDAQRQKMLTLWPVTSPHAHARIVSRDATAARAMPGVVAVLLAEDIPGSNDVGAVRQDETLLAVTEVCFHGHLVAVVVAEDETLARRAAAAVVVEYEPLPIVLGAEAAIAADSFHTNGHRIARGDVTDALARAPHRLRGTMHVGGQEHFYLETHAASAEPGDDGDVVVRSSTQHPSEVQAVVSHVLHLPRNKVVVQAPRMGGGFGGKETQGNTWAALVALAAMKTGARFGCRSSATSTSRSRVSDIPSSRPGRSASTTRECSSARRSTSPPTAAGRWISRSPSATARSSTSTTHTTSPRWTSSAASRRPTCVRTRPSAASADRRAWS